jgi:CHAT domain-containing protein
VGSKPSVVALDDIRGLIPKDAALLAYALGDTCSFLWAIDRKGHDLIELPSRAALTPDVSRLRDALTKPGAGDAALKSAARALYKSLVEPASARLAKKKTLIIVPDGFLFEIPYEVLLAKDAGDGAGWGDLSFLTRSFTTLYAPSASVYATLAGAKRPPRYELDLLALGDPDYTGLAGGRETGSAGAGGAGVSLSALPFSRDEVEKIASSTKPERAVVLVGLEASEAALKKDLGAGTARIVHLAAHGLVDPAEPARSCIALSPDSASHEDGFFYTLEVLSVPIEARLVVLSACESAKGTLSRGEGVVGLSRSFIGAGAGGVVASLWKVSDESTSALMKEFYDRMIGKKTPAAVALCDARKALIENKKYAHPFHWSPFVMIGTDRAPW